MTYQINKKDIVNKFKNFVDSKSTKEDDYGKKKNKKTVSPLDKYEILCQFKFLYQWLLDNTKLDIRRSYIHNDSDFKEIYSLIQSHINNKIRTNSQGNIYLSVHNDKVKLFGNDSEQDKYITSNKNNLVNLFRYIVDEINDLLSGQLPEDNNRVMLRDSIKEQHNIWLKELNKKFSIDSIAENIINKIPADIVVSVHSCRNFQEFSNIFIDVYNNILEESDIYERHIIEKYINKNNIQEIISDVRNSCAMSEIIIKEG